MSFDVGGIHYIETKVYNDTYGRMATIPCRTSALHYELLPKRTRAFLLLKELMW